MNFPSKSVDNILIINKAIPPSIPSSSATASGCHGSSRSLNVCNYKTVSQYCAHNEIDLHRFNGYTNEIDYSNAAKNSNRELHVVHTPITERSAHSRHNSIVTAQDPRFSAFGYPQTVVLSNNQPEPEGFVSKEIALYGKLAWFSFLFFLPIGIIALKKFYESKRFRHKNPKRAEAASEVTRFVGTFAILLGVITYMLILALRLRITYQNGDSFM